MRRPSAGAAPSGSRGGGLGPAQNCGSYGDEKPAPILSSCRPQVAAAGTGLELVAQIVFWPDSESEEGVLRMVWEPYEVFLCGIFNRKSGSGTVSLSTSVPSVLRR